MAAQSTTLSIGMTPAEEASIRAEIDSIKGNSWRLVAPLEWVPVIDNRAPQRQLTTVVCNTATGQVRRGLQFYGLSYISSPGADVEFGLTLKLNPWNAEAPIVKACWKANAFHYNCVDEANMKHVAANNYVCSIYQGRNLNRSIREILTGEMPEGRVLNPVPNDYIALLRWICNTFRIENAEGIPSPWDAGLGDLL